MKIETTKPLGFFQIIQYHLNTHRKVKVGHVLSSPEHVTLPTCFLTGTWEKFVAVFYDPLKS